VSRRAYRYARSRYFHELLKKMDVRQKTNAGEPSFPVAKHPVKEGIRSPERKSVSE
jgi:hypothetical protein